MLLLRIYGILVLSYGLVLLVAAFAWSVLPLSPLHHDYATPVTFLVAAVLSIPAIYTYTSCGLNTDSSEAKDPEVYQRHRQLGKHCPAWPFIWRGVLVTIGFAWLLAVLVPNSVHPFLAFSGSFATFAGVWTLYIYPIAKQMSLNE